MRVVKWCGNPAVRGQAQLKLQVRVHNSGKRRLDLDPTHIRLVVLGFNRARWSPPRIGGRTTDRPIRTRYRGRRVWAIPPNAERAYDRASGGYATFATHWNAPSLAPGRTFEPRDHETGAVVFYVPMGRKDPTRLDGVVGLAYVDGRDIVVLCPPDRWGKRVPEGSF